MYLLSYDLSRYGHDHIKQALLKKGYQEILPNSPLPPGERRDLGLNERVAAYLQSDLRRVGLALKEQGFPLSEPISTIGKPAKLPNTTFIHDEKTDLDIVPDLYKALEDYNQAHPEQKGEIISVLCTEIINPLFWSKKPT